MKEIIYCEDCEYRKGSGVFCYHPELKETHPVFRESSYTCCIENNKDNSCKFFKKKEKITGSELFDKLIYLIGLFTLGAGVLYFYIQFIKLF